MNNDKKPNQPLPGSTTPSRGDGNGKPPSFDDRPAVLGTTGALGGLTMPLDEEMIDDRAPRSVSDTRGTRLGEERHLTEDRNLTDDERLRIFQQQFAQAELPNLPPIPGHHVCWLTTTNPRDPVSGRLRLGYQLVRAEEIPGMEHITLKTGEYAGTIGVNEMIAAKIPLRLYQSYMKDAHHDRPIANAQGIYDNIEQMGAMAEESRGKLDVDEGFNNLRADQRIAQFDIK